MSLLIQFLLRLTFGLALGMAITSPKLVTSGYFRNHLYVTLGLASLAALLSVTVSPEVLGYAVAAAVCSYVGSVYWLFERPAPGKLMLVIVALSAWAGAANQTRSHTHTVTRQTVTRDTVTRDTITRGTVTGDTVTSDTVTSDMAASDRHDIPALNSTSSDAGLAEYPQALRKNLNGWQRSQVFLSAASIFSSGLLLGITMAAMLLGHWYLNTPTMDLVPLRRLILAMGVALVLQTGLSTLGLWGEIAATAQVSLQWILFIALRWTFGLVGVAAMTWMAWQTLKIPNTQSATGILYVAVIGTFVGETMALLLSSESLFPL